MLPFRISKPFGCAEIALAISVSLRLRLRLQLPLPLRLPLRPCLACTKILAICRASESVFEREMNLAFICWLLGAMANGNRAAR